MQLDQLIKSLLENKEAFVTFVVSLLAIIKLTAWGRAQAAALDAVIGVIEQVGAREVKNSVASSQSDLPLAAQDALSDSVAKADPKKTQPSLLARIAREVFRGL